jgi:hypothetical protein
MPIGVKQTSARRPLNVFPRGATSEWQIKVRFPLGVRVAWLWVVTVPGSGTGIKQGASFTTTAPWPEPYALLRELLAADAGWETRSSAPRESGAIAAMSLFIEPSDER